MRMSYFTRSELEKLSKKELIERLIGQSSRQNPIDVSQYQYKLPFHQKQYRKIALKVAYFGWDYDGLAIQCEDNNSSNTIERHLYDAMYKTRMVPSWLDLKYIQENLGVDVGDDTSQIQDRVGLWKMLDFQRSGRTDKGVSATSQVLSLFVRSNLPAGHYDAFSFTDLIQKYKCDRSEQPYVRPLNSDTDLMDDGVNEIQYVTALNSQLPDHIRILGWAPVPHNFSARFDCKGRSYKYLFPIDFQYSINNVVQQGRLELQESPVDGSKSSNKQQQQQQILNLDAMRQACQILIGEHNFRNFCKVDKSKDEEQQNFMRTIYQADIERLDESGFACFTIRGSAFLWHQIRNIMAVLLSVGAGHDDASIVTRLLDTQQVSAKPNYKMASEISLVLWDTEFESMKDENGVAYDLQFIGAAQDIAKSHRTLQQLQETHATKAMMLKMFMDAQLQDLRVSYYDNSGQNNTKSIKYFQLSSTTRQKSSILQQSGSSKRSAVGTPNQQPKQQRLT
ncbi:hypothetical protein MP228_004848 [Amoeboaphelidium protococcarum]|nr:hypothetical protein MP228_004848 [Amoeboaphelidium protococcarum]